MGPVISMVDVLVDQLMEISTSSLNFTVDGSLIQFLSNGSPSAKGSSSPIASQTTAALMSSNPGRKQSSKSAQGNGAQVKWTKSGASSGARPAINAELTLKIKCVARILHLTMSDEIKLRLVNRTRESVVNDNSTSRAGSQQQRKQNIGNSGKSDYQLHEHNKFNELIEIFIHENRNDQHPTGSDHCRLHGCHNQADITRLERLNCDNLTRNHMYRIDI